MQESQVTIPRTIPDKASGTDIVCPRCGTNTKKIIVDVNRVDWASVPFVGFAAILFPSLSRKELQCDHCGKIFLPQAPPAKKGDHLIGFILAGFSLLMVGLVIWLLFFGMRVPPQ